jgi:DNA (cytosine-5)-methyltransferase 1
MPRRGELSDSVSDAPRFLGSLFAGIGGFDLGFERAGWKTLWQVEIDPTCRAVLADRFPDAARMPDVRQCGRHNLPAVECITAGFPCQDISPMGMARHERRQLGLGGDRSSLVWAALRIVGELRPAWLVLENVPALLSVRAGRDFAAVIRALADMGYVGCWRVLDGSGFGVPQVRRRLFVVAGLGRHPDPEFLADAAPVAAIPRAALPIGQPCPADAWAGYTSTTHNQACVINLGCEVLVAEAGRWHSMAQRARAARLHGLPLGLDPFDQATSMAAGNAVIPAVAEWIAGKLPRAQGP